MSNINVKQAIFAILSKGLTTEQALSRVHPSERAEVVYALSSILAKAKMDKSEMCKTDKNGKWSLNKAEPLSKPPVSEAQRKAMWAAASGHSDLGIPSSVGKDFADSDEGGKLPLHKVDECTPHVNTSNHTDEKKKKKDKEQEEEFVPKAETTTNPKAKLHKSEELTKGKQYPGHEHPGASPRFRHGSHIMVAGGSPEHGYDVHEHTNDDVKVHERVPMAELDAMTKPHHFALRTTGKGSHRHDCYQEAVVHHHGKGDKGKAWSSTAMPRGDKLKKSNEFRDREHFLEELAKSLEKARIDEGLSDEHKKQSRKFRSKKTDKLDHKEKETALGSEVTGEHGAHWRKPKSGEKHIKLNESETAEHKSFGGEKAAPKSGKAFVGTTGTSEQGIHQGYKQMEREHKEEHDKSMHSGITRRIKNLSPQPGVSAAHDEHMKTKIKDAVKNVKPMAKSWTDNAQWDLNKAIKEGPTLDYGKMNPKKNYAEMEAKAPVIDYGGNRMSAPKQYAGAAEHAAGVRAKLEAESKETGADTIARRQKMNKPTAMAPTKKNEGINLEANPTEADKARMTAKNEMAGYGGAAMMAMKADAQPGEPGHEEEEKKKAKKIKDEAEGLLDMHKKDDGLRTVTVPKDNEMKIKATRAQPAC